MGNIEFGIEDRCVMDSILFTSGEAAASALNVIVATIAAAAPVAATPFSNIDFSISHYCITGRYRAIEIRQ